MTDIFDSDVVWATAEGPEPGWWTLQPDSAAPKELGRRVALSSLFWKVAIASGKAERMPACEPNLCVEEAPVWADLPADPAMPPLLLSRLLAEGTAQGGVVVQHLNRESGRHLFSSDSCSLIHGAADSSKAAAEQRQSSNRAATEQ